jgi:two-component system chemotaxis response regulator CheB
MKKIRVVVIDDSAYNRRTIIRMLEQLPEVQVVGYAADGEEGIRKVVDLRPDLVTLDLEMPKMDGYTLLRIIMSRFATPVIVISSRNDKEGVFKALELGAIDFIAKPGKTISDDLLKIQEDLHNKVRSVFNLNMALVRAREVTSPTPQPEVKRHRPLPAEAEPRGKRPVSLVAIGSSTGGPPALQAIFSAFAQSYPFAVVVSQHMPPGFTRAFAERLNRSSGFDIREAADGDKVLPGRILIAPGAKNLVFERVGDGVVARVVDPAFTDRYLPSVDVMFESCAAVFGSKMLAVVLTGMGNDGSKGVRAVKKMGGQVIAESEESAVVFGMPREAIATGLVDRVVRFDQVADEILLRCGFIS